MKTLSSLLIPLAAATTLTAAPQKTDDAPMPSAPPPAAATERPAELHALTAITGRSVYNANDEEIGEITALLVERGRGVVSHAIVSAGGLLGIGAKEVAVPYGDLRWNRADDRIMLDMTPEQFERAVAFKAADWNLADGSRERSHRQLGDRADRWTEDPYLPTIRSASPQRIDGTITAVTRVTNGGNEMIVATVRTRDADRKPLRVVLGPSWYVMGQPVAPMRDMPIRAEVWPVTNADACDAVAGTVTLDGNVVRLRESNGQAAWLMPVESADAGGMPFEYIRLNDVVGMPCSAQAKDCGEIENAIIDCPSGIVMFFAIDPDENLLGIADELRLVPWTIASIGAEKVRLDASHTMIVNSRTVDLDRLDDLENTTVWTNIYTLFGVDAPSLAAADARRTERTRGAGAPHAGDADWSAHGAFAKAVRKGKETTVSGTVSSLETTHPLGAGGQPASALVIDTDQTRRVVVIGPEWYVARQSLGIKPGDTVRVTCVEATLPSGEVITVARSLTANGTTTVVWRDGAPAWDRK